MIKKFKTIGDVPPPPRVPLEHRMSAFAEAVAQANALSPPPIPRGVQKFRSFQEAQDAREREVIEHVRRLRRSRE